MMKLIYLWESFFLSHRFIYEWIECKAFERPSHPITISIKEKKQCPAYVLCVYYALSLTSTLINFKRLAHVLCKNDIFLYTAFFSNILFHHTKKSNSFAQIKEHKLLMKSQSLHPSSEVIISYKSHKTSCALIILFPKIMYI